MIGTYRDTLSLFTPRERRSFYLLMLLMVFVAFAEIVGISSVLFFLNILAEPSQIEERRILRNLYDFGNFTSTYTFLIFIAVATFFVVVTSLIIKAANSYVIIRFSNIRGYEMAYRLFCTYMSQPYIWSIKQNSAEIAKNVLSEVDHLVHVVIVPQLKIISGSVSSFAIIFFLIVVDPFVSLVAGGLLIGSYAILYFLLRQIVQHAGQNVLSSNRQKYMIVSEATGGFKQIKLMGLEDKYTQRFNTAAYEKARYQSKNQIFGELPRFALEALTFGILLTVILILLLRSGGNLTEIIPTLGIFAFSVMRILPAIQQVYNSLLSVRSGSALLNYIMKEYHSGPPVMPVSESISKQDEAISLNRSLVMENVAFSYDQGSKSVFSSLDLEILAYTTIGIVGGTGAGKTTLIDIILGLHSVKSGKLIIDGHQITESNVRAWQNTIGYVPQEIFLTNGTIAENIAFGMAPVDIDFLAVERSAKTAALDDFILRELPDGYETKVGERGVRLSGGQRQRIGIARALYANPSLLIMDEATSSLDNITERVVMEAVHNIGSEKTIILIAHRLSTVKDCDRIFLMERGKIAAAGTYDELVSSNKIFREMAKAVS